MKRFLVYDLPTRAFHWLFVGLFLTAFLIAKNIDDESFLFVVHMMAGLTLFFAIFLRIIWGMVGSRYAKFSSFALNPKDLIEYFKGIIKGEKKFWPGHNPASSWAALGMMSLVLGLATTGILMTSGQKETFEDFHELAANGLIVLVGLHILGIFLHTVTTKDIIGLSMVDGRKSHVMESDSIKSSHPAVGVAFIFAVGLFAGFVYKSYDASTGKLSILGQQLELSEVEGEHKHNHNHDHGKVIENEDETENEMENEAD